MFFTYFHCLEIPTKIETSANNAKHQGFFNNAKNFSENLYPVQNISITCSRYLYFLDKMFPKYTSQLVVNDKEDLLL